MKNVATHVLAVMALITAAVGQQQGDSLSVVIEKAQALDKEAQQVRHTQPIQFDWEYAKKQVRRAEQFEMKPVDVLNLIPISAMYVKGAIVRDLADCASLHSLKMSLKLQSAIWDLDHSEQQLLQKRLENIL